jgi:predicted phosphodiesterase
MQPRRLALISDIHGNEVALRAVLRDIERRGADEIACLGDVSCLGPRPRETLALVLEHCDYLILGNHDEYMFAPDAVFAHTSAPPVIAAVDQCRSELSAADIDALRGFADKLAPHADLLLFHGSPESNNCDLVAETPDAELVQRLAGHTAQVLAGGHTHVQLVRQHRGRWLINPGSVGMPFERFVDGAPPTILPHAEYAIVELSAATPSVTLCQVELDRTALIRDVSGWTGEMAGYLLQQYRR